jgi:DNA-binding beta-propeller fold protein YncE
MRRCTRTPALLAIGALALTACGRASSSPVSPGGRGPHNESVAETLFVPTEEGLEVVSAPSGEVEASFPGGMASPDFSVLVSTEAREKTTVVRRAEADGTELDTWTIPGAVTARVVSPTGTQVALTGAEDGSTTYAPQPRAHTRVVVAEAGQKPEQFRLRGNFEPEAFSTDGSQLFLLEYIPALAPSKYRVRRLFLDKEKVMPIGRLKTAAPNQMQGTGRAQVYSPWGDELYTLYTQQSSAGHGETAFSGNHAFVHLLNLEGSWTHCIDLPHTFGHGDATASALTVSPDGSRLYVVDWTSGVVAVAEPEKLKVTHTSAVRFGDPDDRTFAVASDDSLYVAGGAEVVVLDAATFEVRSRWPLPAEIAGLALGADGSRLYVSTGDTISAVDATTGEELDETPVPGALGLAHVLHDL